MSLVSKRKLNLPVRLCSTPKNKTVLTFPSLQTSSSQSSSVAVAFFCPFSPSVAPKSSSSSSTSTGPSTPSYSTSPFTTSPASLSSAWTSTDSESPSSLFPFRSRREISYLTQRLTLLLRRYIHTMSPNVRSKFARGINPFDFKRKDSFIRPLDRGISKLNDKNPCVVMASPGFLTNGVSRELLERWAPDPRNGLIITGYSVEGVMARVRPFLNHPSSGY